MIEVPAAITTSGTFACVASGAAASAAGVTPKPAMKATLSLTISSWASRLVLSGTAPSSLRTTSIFLPATLAPFCCTYSRTAASICRPVEACWPVIGRIRPILTASCAGARSIADSTSTMAADAVTSPLRDMRFPPKAWLVVAVILYVEEHGFAFALQADVEPIGGSPAAVLALRDERRPALPRHQSEDGIGVVCLLVGEIQARVALAQHAAREHGDADMRSLRPVRTGDGARLDGLEAVGPALVGAGAAEALEGRIWVRARVGRMRIAAGGIGLPDLDHGVADRPGVAVEHAALDADAFAGRIRRHQIVADGRRPIVIAGRERDGVIRPHRLRRRDAGHVRAGPASGCGRAARRRTRRRAPNPAPWWRDRSVRSSARAPSRPRPS